MDSADGVDVSWLHHSQKDKLVRTRSTSSAASNKSDPSPSNQTDRGNPPPTSNPSEPNGSSAEVSPSASSNAVPVPQNSKQGKSTPIAASPKEATTGTAATTGANTSKPGNSKPSPPPRRNSWIASLSSKFSTGSTPPSSSPLKDSAGTAKQTPPGARTESLNPFGAAVSPKDFEKKDGQQDTPPSPTQKTGHPSFFHNALRKFSSAGGGGGLGKITPQSGVLPRRVMNVDSTRDRCKVPELDPAKLRRVAFCVDVEIAGTSRRSDSEDDAGAPTTEKKHSSSRDQSKRSKKSESKSDSKSTSKEAVPATETPSPPLDATTKTSTTEGENGKEKSTPQGEEPTKEPAKESTKEPTKRQEKKKKSEEERKERREKKRRLAEENGSVPLQLDMGYGAGGSSSKSGAHRSHKNQDQPTTDPVRIYRRCCQLRETGVLKKLVEQISSPSSVLAESPGTVAVLDLSGFWMTLPDMITFSDWLAIVPVRKLILNNCGLTDEALRVILGGLLSTKTIEASRYIRGLSKNKGETVPREERYGTIEKLSLKGNPKIGPEGWRHIGLFVHMSRSLKGIDLSGIPFPRPAAPTNSPTSMAKPATPATDIPSIFARAIADRFAGDRLEELALNECYLTAENLEKICDAVTTLGLRRFGIANNDLTKEGLEHVIRYFRAGHCEGLDLGGNNLEDNLGLLASSIEKARSLTALSLADCSLSPKSLCGLLQSLTTLPNFRFIDLSHNPELFSTQPDSLAMLRRYLPKMPELKRIHLADVSLSSEHAIALAEILPDCPKLCHINILENPEIEALASTSDPVLQEEACALYASFTAAVRVSRTLIAIDIEVPTAENNEVVKALASQIVAYSLRNLERGEFVEEFASVNGTGEDKHDVPVPEILAHIVGRSDDADEVVEDDAKLAPDEDYVISGTGVVKALGICLGNADNATEGLESPPPSGMSTPVRRVSQPPVAKKPRDMSKNLLESARKIRVRLQPALVREDRAGNDLNYRRLQFLDGTLERMIQRFEDEFPDTRIQSGPAPPPDEPASTMEDDIPGDNSVTTEPPVPVSVLAPSPEGDTALDDDDGDQFALRLSRTSSNTSLHSRALTSEEGQVHRLGQHLRRDILDSEFDNGGEHTSQSPSDEADFAALREKLDRLRNSEMETRIETVGADKALEEVGSSLEELLALQKQDPEAFATFKESQIAALINAGLRKRED